MADGNACWFEFRKGRLQWEGAEEEAHCEAFVADGGRGCSKQDIRNIERLIRFSVGDSFSPHRHRIDTLYYKSRFSNVSVEFDDGCIDLLLRGVKPGWDMDGQVVSIREHSCVPTMMIREDGDSDDVAQVCEEFIDARGIERIEYPDPVITYDCVTYSLPVFVRMYKPANPRIHSSITWKPSDWLRSYIGMVQDFSRDATRFRNASVICARLSTSQSEE